MSPLRLRIISDSSLPVVALVLSSACGQAPNPTTIAPKAVATLAPRASVEPAPNASASIVPITPAAKPQPAPELPPSLVPTLVRSKDAEMPFRIHPTRPRIAVDATGGECDIFDVEQGVFIGTTTLLDCKLWPVATPVQECAPGGSVCVLDDDHLVRMGEPVALADPCAATKSCKELAYARFTADGGRIALLRMSTDPARIFDTTSGKLVRSIALSEDVRPTYDGFGFGSLGLTLLAPPTNAPVIEGSMAILRFWEAKNDKAKQRLFALATHNYMGPIPIAVDPYGRWVFTSAGGQGESHFGVYDLATWTETRLSRNSNTSSAVACNADCGSYDDPTSRLLANAVSAVHAVSIVAGNSATTSRIRDHSNVVAYAWRSQ